MDDEIYPPYASAEPKAERDAWTRGYLVAVGTYLNLEGGPCTYGEELLGASGIKRDEANSLGLTEYDIDMINAQFDQMEERQRWVDEKKALFTAHRTGGAA